LRIGRGRGCGRGRLRRGSGRRGRGIRRREARVRRRGPYRRRRTCGRRWIRRIGHGGRRRRRAAAAWPEQLRDVEPETTEAGCLRHAATELIDEARTGLTSRRLGRRAGRLSGGRRRGPGRTRGSRGRRRSHRPRRRPARRGRRRSAAGRCPRARRRGLGDGALEVEEAHDVPARGRLCARWRRPVCAMRYQSARTPRSAIGIGLPALGVRVEHAFRRPQRLRRRVRRSAAGTTLARRPMS
jgi:hypothetical protein